MVNGNRIRQLRESEGLSIVELAARVGASQPYLTQIEQGYKQPSVVLLKRIADFFRVSMDTLMDKGSA